MYGGTLPFRDGHYYFMNMKKAEHLFVSRALIESVC